LHKVEAAHLRMMQRCRKLDLGFHRRNITGVRLAQVR